MNKIICLGLTVIIIMPLVGMVGNVGPAEDYALGNVGLKEGYSYGKVGPKGKPKASQFNILSDEDRQLIIAVDHGNTAQVHALLAKGANAGLQTFSGESLTALAARKGYNQIVKLLNNSLESKAKL